VYAVISLLSSISFIIKIDILDTQDLL